MARLSDLGERWRKAGWRRRLLILWAATSLIMVFAWQLAEVAATPKALLKRAGQAAPGRAAKLYARLAGEMPELAEYCELWSAQACMPSPTSVQQLLAVAAYRPNSPAAFEAHLTLARYYAGLAAEQAVDEYLSALTLDDRADLRVELARHLEDRSDMAGAYNQYRAAFGKERIDAFADMRRTAADPLTVARDLFDRYFYTDVVDVLRHDQRCEAHCLRARALSALGRTEEAQAAHEACEACNNPAPAPAAEEAPVASPSSAPAPVAPAPAEPEPAPIESGSPVERWSATWDLDLAEVEGGRPLTDVLPVYLDVAASGVYVSDDAAYRALVLAQRRGDAAAEARARDLLAAMQPNWYAWLGTGALAMDMGIPFPEDAVADASSAIRAKVDALNHVGRDDLALEELRYAARLSDTPETISWAALELQERGEFYTTYRLASRILADTTHAAPAFWRLAYPRAFEEQVLRWATEYDVPPNLVWGVMRQESQFQPLATSSAGAVGLMQLMPSNVTDFNEAEGTDYTSGDIYSPQVGIRVGAQHLGRLLRYYDDDTLLALMAYNAGAGNVDAWLQEPGRQDRDDLLRFIPFGETREYVARVGLNYQVYESLYGEGN